MASKDPFFYSKFVPSIPCTECGNNMYCFRRTPESEGERQWFYCATCSNEAQRVAGAESSDATIQTEAEKITGVDAGQS